MSSGNFAFSKYESNAGNVYNARVQPETLLLTIDGNANDEPAGAIDSEGSARMNGGRRTIGINARAVYVSFDESPPTGYSENETIKLPIMTQAVWNGIAKGQTGTYLGGTVRVVGKVPEYVN